MRLTQIDGTKMLSSPNESAAEEPASIVKTEEMAEAIAAFERWLERNGPLSFDPYDLWGTGYGLKARRLYYDKHVMGLPMIAPLLLSEILTPSLRRLFVEPERFATSDAQLVLAFVNLYRSSGDDRYLNKARRLAEEIRAYAIPGYSGLCWGYPFDWQNQRGMWAKDVPYITCTPYCYEAFAALFDVTSEETFAEVARSIAKFVFTDLRDTETAADAAAASYSPKDDSLVVNASAYRAWVLFDAAERFGNEEYLTKAERNLAFILQSQRDDGSWFYAMDEHGKFIDHFHTCFVLKNLVKINRMLGRAEVQSAIENGYRFYARALFDAEGLPKSFAIKPRTGIVRLEMYDFAEAITLGTLLRNEIPEAYEHAQRLADVLCHEYQLRDGHFVTRVYRGGVRHTFPFLRWPQAQLFLALTNLFVAAESEKEEKAPRAALASSEQST